MSQEYTSQSPSEDAINYTIKRGVERGAVYVTTGLIVGGLASLVLARGGGGSASRKVITAFGAGAGLGSAWTRCSMDLEDLLKDIK